ncbi:GerAB/ArcD/ProY family transporter [Clostridium magnum]|uniref:Spore germination protein YndE n=1 Tax=Clostridium magnum DSM 2767 TaxID=1121326 RepID=A0A162R9V5_9CLOT|nr:GerAB/ArcD/ProY family transporter [Clostridium magnum]KZL89607.1 spore germination protein YndE [Clostridium magnum DSM 2767]SHH73959.1 spore germination protein KB [Clostridium magnum DSM 2767]
MKTKISAVQLFCSIILAPYGSALLFLITPNAKQDAWIAMLIYILPAIILQIIYTGLWSKYPDDTIVTYMPKIFGKFIGTTLSIIYTIFFAYEAARVLRDITSLIVITTMPKISFNLTTLLLVSIVGYSVYLGMEDLCRAGQFILTMLVSFFMLEWIFLFTSPDSLKFYNLKPVLENGIIFVIKEGWKLITFPYGETVLLTMLYPSTVERSKVRKIAVLAIIFLGILLTLSSIMFISVLGIDFASTSLFPLLQTMRLIHVGEYFDRIDIFLILIMVVGGFIKISLFTYGAMLGTAQLTKLEDTKYLAVPFSILIFGTSLVIAKNYPQHIYIGQILTLTYVHLPLAVFIPIIALLVQRIKESIKKK